MRSRSAPLAAIFFALLALPALALAGPTLSPKAAQGKAIIEQAQCTRCHAITDASGAGHGVAPAARDMHCVDCHTWILDTKGKPAEIAKMRETFPDWDRYLETIVHFTELPDLGTLTRKVHPAFVRRFLDAPFDLRPHLEESMIPLRLSAPQKDAVVAYLSELSGDRVAPAPKAPAKPPSAAQIAAGKARFVQRACPTCHLVGNAKLLPGATRETYKALAAAGKLAPNLRYVRERIPRAVLLRYIADPQSVDPKSRMPKLPLFDDDAERIADFLLHGEIELAGGQHAPAKPAIPTLKRPVLYDEVFDEVFGKICVHCHMDPASNNGDGGAGNSGGLGYAGLKLNLETYAGMKQGLVRGGKRVDIFKPEAAGQPPLLLAALLRRHAEAQRDYRPPFADRAAAGTPTSADRPGMPLGLPPLSVQQIALIKTWIEQGAPGPR